MKSIIKSLVIIAAVAAVAGGATYAYFSDTKNADGNTFSAGTFSMTVDTGGQPATHTLSNMKPGDTSSYTWNILNAGSIDGYLNIDSIAFTGGSDLQAVLKLKVALDSNCDGTADAGSPLYDNLASLAPTNLTFDASLTAAHHICVINTVYWPSDDTNTADNAAKGESTTYGMSFELTQNSI